ncbi:MAG: hypothetical protein ACLROH_04900, partial [Streptococcus sp.]
YEMPNGMRIETDDDTVAVDRLKNFDRKELGYDFSLFKTTRNIYHAPLSLSYLDEFDSLWQNDEYFRDVTEEFLETLNLAHKEYSPEFLYYVMLYNLFSEFLEDINMTIPQMNRWAIKIPSCGIFLHLARCSKINHFKLEKYNGCILEFSQVRKTNSFSCRDLLCLYRNGFWSCVRKI